MAQIRPRHIREANLRELADMLVRQVRFVDIVAHFGFSEPTIAKDIREVHRRWRTQANIDIERRVSEELDRLASVEREAWTAWLRSIEERRQVSVLQEDPNLPLLPANPTLKEIERIAEEAWVQVDEPKSEESPDKPNGVRRRIDIRHMQSNGEPRFLEIILRCSAERRKLLGLDAPTKVDITVRRERLIAIGREEGLTEAEAVQFAEEYLRGR